MKKQSYAALISVSLFMVLSVCSCSSDPKSDLLAETFAAVENRDGMALQVALGASVSPSDADDFVKEVESFFGNIRPKRPWDKTPEADLGSTITSLDLKSHTSYDTAISRPFIGSNGKHGSLELEYRGSDPTPCAISVTFFHSSTAVSTP